MSSDHCPRYTFADLDLRFPGVSLYITLWYPKRECGFRGAVFFSAATVAGAFSGLLARLFSLMGMFLPIYLPRALS